MMNSKLKISLLLCFLLHLSSAQVSISSVSSASFDDYACTGKVTSESPVLYESNPPFISKSYEADLSETANSALCLETRNSTIVVALVQISVIHPLEHEFDCGDISKVELTNIDCHCPGSLATWGVPAPPDKLHVKGYTTGPAKGCFTYFWNHNSRADFAYLMKIVPTPVAVKRIDHDNSEIDLTIRIMHFDSANDFVWGTELTGPADTMDISGQIPTLGNFDFLVNDYGVSEEGQHDWAFERNGDHYILPVNLVNEYEETDFALPCAIKRRPGLSWTTDSIEFQLRSEEVTEGSHCTDKTATTRYVHPEISTLARQDYALAQHFGVEAVVQAAGGGIGGEEIAASLSIAKKLQIVFIANITASEFTSHAIPVIRTVKCKEQEDNVKAICNVCLDNDGQTGSIVFYDVLGSTTEQAAVKTVEGGARHVCFDIAMDGDLITRNNTKITFCAADLLKSTEPRCKDVTVMVTPPDPDLDEKPVAFGPGVAVPGIALSKASMIILWVLLGLVGLSCIIFPILFCCCNCCMCRTRCWRCITKMSRPRRSRAKAMKMDEEHAREIRRVEKQDLEMVNLDDYE